MRLYGAIQKVEPQDDGTVRVHGIASSEVTDDQGEIVRADAMRAAIPHYMHFPALREMHQLSAAGTTLEAEVGDDGTTRIVAHVVDPVAVAKVRNQVYRGFSIGGRVTQREAGDPRIITGLVLNEISLVDRPANPEAVFDCWKAVACVTEQGREDLAPTTVSPPAREPFNPPVQIWACGMPDHHHRAKDDAVKCLETQALDAAGARLPRSPWTTHGSQPGGEREADCATGSEIVIDAARKAIETAEGALTKTEGPNRSEDPDGSPEPRHEGDYADPGYQSDRKHRYPIDTDRHIRAAWSYINTPSNAARYSAEQVRSIKAKIIAAWREKIDIEGPPSAKGNDQPSPAALTKAHGDAPRLAQIIHELDCLQGELEIEAAIEDDDSSRPRRLQSIISELCGFLNAFLVEETDELLGDAPIDDEDRSQRAPELLALAVSTPEVVRIGTPFKTGNPKMQKLAAAFLTKAKHSQGDQALADMALYACDKCMKIGGTSMQEGAHMAKACDHLSKAGAVPLGASILGTSGDLAHVAPQLRPPPLHSGPGQNATVESSKASGAIAPMGDRRDGSRQNLIDIAHECIRKLTGGMACCRASPSSDSGPAPSGSADAEEVAKAGARHSAETMEHLRTAHSHLVAAGAECDAAGAGEEERQGTELESVKALRTVELAKTLAGERAEKRALVKALSEIVPLLDRLSKRVDDIARTPLPPLTIARGAVSVSKQQDDENTGSASSSLLSPEAIASALAKMSKEEQTLTLIKASYANPITVHGAATSER